MKFCGILLVVAIGAFCLSGCVMPMNTPVYGGLITSDVQGPVAVGDNGRNLLECRFPFTNNGHVSRRIFQHPASCRRHMRTAERHGGLWQGALDRRHALPEQRRVGAQATESHDVRGERDDTPEYIVTRSILRALVNDVDVGVAVFAEIGSDVQQPQRRGMGRACRCATAHVDENGAQRSHPA